MVVALALVAAGCDNFSFFGELDRLADKGPPNIYPNTAVVYKKGFLAFAADGGRPPYIFQAASGGGTITMTSPATAQYTAPSTEALATVRVTDSTGTFSEAQVNVITPPDPLRINPTLITLQVNSGYEFSGMGGVLPYTYSITSGGGVIDPLTGDFTAPGSAATVYVHVEDAYGSIPPPDARVDVVDTGALVLNPLSATVEQGRSQQFIANGGIQGYAYSLLSPNGGAASVDSSGLFAALATAAPGTTYTVEVTDSTVPTAKSAQSTVAIAPAAPTNLVANGRYGTKYEILLTWRDNSVGETGFVIEIRPPNGHFDPLPSGPLPPNTTHCVVDGLTQNVIYTFRIRAYVDPTPIYSAYSELAYAVPNR